VPHRAVGVARAYRWHDRVVAWALRRTSTPPDIVHAWPGGCLMTFAAARQAGVVSLREAPSPHTASAFERAGGAAAALGLEVPRGHSHRDDPQRLLTEIAEFDASDFVLAPSDYVIRTFVERGYAPHRLLRHRYGFDPAAFPPPSAREPERPFTVAFVGRGEPNKGLHHALHAFVEAGLTGVGRFLVCGRIQPDYRTVIADLLDKSGAEELGFVTDMGAVLRGVDVLALPTVTEGSALVVFEAMASGAVPVVSDAAGAPVDHGADGLIHHAGDVAALTDHLAALASNPVRLAAMRARALARRDALTWRGAGADLRDAYRTALSIAEAG
jgi:glycosyltransferase involved in cell wall biosynthesis